MGAFAPLAAVARRRLGEERGLWWASLVLTAGTVLRMLGMPGLYLGTVVVGAAMAVINVLIPVLVRKRFARRRVGTMMGVYALSMGIGSAIVAAMVVPVARAAGGAWQPAIGLAVVPAVLAAAGITPQIRHRSPRAAPAVSAGRPRVARSAVAWSLTVFFGVQTLAFYTTLAWLPSVLVQAGAGRATAGTSQAVLILGIATGGFAAPFSPPGDGISVRTSWPPSWSASPASPGSCSPRPGRRWRGSGFWGSGWVPGRRFPACSTPTGAPIPIM